MVMQGRLNADEVKRLNPLNSEVYQMITSFGDGYEASAISQEMAEAINGATSKMAVSLGLADTQELSTKLIAIKGKENIKDKEGLKEYFRLLLKKRIKEALREAGLDPEAIEELDEKEKQQLEQTETQNEMSNNQPPVQDEKEDLFLFERVGNNFRLQVREGIDERNREDRQRAMMERSLRIIAALEKIKDAVKDNGTIELSADMFEGLEPKEVEQQMGLLKAMGVRDAGENRGVISLAAMRDDRKGEKTWGQNIADLKKWFEERGITLDGKAPVTVNGLDEITREEPNAKVHNIDNNEMSL